MDNPSPQSPGDAADSQATDKAASEPARKEGIKETIESILVAFILAFVFRAYVVEAFVIPTGSMAPTLLGAHMRFRCEDCGYQFEANYPNPNPDGSPKSEIAHYYSFHCPNCGFKVQRKLAPDGRVEQLPVRYGDRILVLKYLYLLERPQRWDVVVFKTPDVRENDEKLWYTANYIKRLVGLPGESVMILDGDIYVRPTDFKGANHEGWTVQPKPRHAQEAMWRVVNDNDFQPRATVAKWTSPWQSRAGGRSWTPGPVRTFDDLSGSGALEFNKDANPVAADRSAFPLTDWLPYNESDKYTEIDRYETNAYASDHPPRWYVSDLKLKFTYDRRAGDGPLRAKLTRLGHAFTAEFTPGSVKLICMSPGGKRKELGPVALDGASPLNVEFTNVDYRVMVRVNGKDLIQTTPTDFAPDVKDLLERQRRRRDDAKGPANQREVFEAPSVALEAERQTCDISHLSLWRDVYYTPGQGYSNVNLHGSPPGEVGGEPVRLRKAGEPGAAPGIPAENEYFVLGDNSILSGDARVWSRDVDLRDEEDLYIERGRVSERFLLGKAFFVYWPAGFSPFSRTGPGIVPNFGEMRFIH